MGIPKRQQALTILQALVFAVFVTELAAQDLSAARTKAQNSATQLNDELAALIPEVRGWDCQTNDNSKLLQRRGIAVIPQINVICKNAAQSLNINLSFNPTNSSHQCQHIASTQKGVANGTVKPDLFRFFENENWKIMRSSGNLNGCAAGAIALTASGNRTQEVFQAGPATTDDFAEAMLGLDVSAILDAAALSDHAAALDHLMDLLAIQSSDLAAIIPSPPMATRKMIYPQTKTANKLPIALLLVSLPAAAADLKIGQCRVHIELSAAPNTIYEAKNTGRSWAKSGGEDGAREYAFLRRNTKRFVGQQRVDGSGIEAFVDNSVIVRVVIPSNKPCQADFELVQRLFNEIIAHDLTGFGYP